MTSHRNKVTKLRYRVSFALEVDDECARPNKPKEHTAVLKFGFIFCGIAFANIPGFFFDNWLRYFGM